MLFKRNYQKGEIMTKPTRKQFSKDRPVYFAKNNVAFPHVEYSTWMLEVLKPWLERNRKGGV